jgi:hypothetical protein
VRAKIALMAAAASALGLAAAGCPYDPCDGVSTVPSPGFSVLRRVELLAESITFQMGYAPGFGSCAPESSVARVLVSDPRNRPVNATGSVGTGGAVSLTFKPNDPGWYHLRVDLSDGATLQQELLVARQAFERSVPGLTRCGQQVAQLSNGSLLCGHALHRPDGGSFSLPLPLGVPLAVTGNTVWAVTDAGIERFRDDGDSALLEHRRAGGPAPRSQLVPAGEGLYALDLAGNQIGHYAPLSDGGISSAVRALDALDSTLFAAAHGDGLVVAAGRLVPVELAAPGTPGRVPCPKVSPGGQCQSFTRELRLSAIDDASAGWIDREGPTVVGAYAAGLWRQAADGQLQQIVPLADGGWSVLAVSRLTSSAQLEGGAPLRIVDEGLTLFPRPVDGGEISFDGVKTEAAIALLENDRFFWRADGGVWAR